MYNCEFSFDFIYIFVFTLINVFINSILICSKYIYKGKKNINYKN